MRRRHGQSEVHGLTRDGRITRFARNNVVLAGERNALAGDDRASEFAGASFSPDGRWLFVNVQSPGITLAITGSWERGLPWFDAPRSGQTQQWSGGAAPLKSPGRNAD